MINILPTEELSKTRAQLAEIFSYPHHVVNFEEYPELTAQTPSPESIRVTRLPSLSVEQYMPPYVAERLKAFGPPTQRFANLSPIQMTDLLLDTGLITYGGRIAKRYFGLVEINQN